MSDVLSLPSFYKWDKGSMKRLNDLPKATQSASSTTGIRTQPLNMSGLNALEGKPSFFYPSSYSYHLVGWNYPLPVAESQALKTKPVSFPPILKSNPCLFVPCPARQIRAGNRPSSSARESKKTFRVTRTGFESQQSWPSHTPCLSLSFLVYEIGMIAALPTGLLWGAEKIRPA